MKNEKILLKIVSAYVRVMLDAGIHVRANWPDGLNRHKYKKFMTQLTKKSLRLN